MTMKKIQLTTYWTPGQAHCILAFLEELRAMVLAHYADEIADQQPHSEDDDWGSDLENNVIL
jgi:hypothetical protein